jgi:hypothetical protein
MGRGQAWVNGHGIGRFWNKKAEVTESCKKACDPFGPYYGEKCPVGCGEASQDWYHVPAEWLDDVSDGSDAVEVVLFDERGGDPTGVRFVALAG